MSETLVLGLGNILLKDEGVGVRVVERLRERYVPPEGVEFLDGGVRGLALLPYLEGVSRLLIIDAVRAGKEPGTLVRLAGDEIPAVLSPKISPHQEGLADLLWVAKVSGPCPSEIVLWGVEPAHIETSLELSAPVEAQVDALVQKVIEELARWGVEVRPREAGDQPEEPDALRRNHVLRNSR